MTRYDGGTTSPTLLRRVADWQDLPAWHELFTRYDPLLRRWSRPYLHDETEVAEVCQRIWVELANRMIAFRYNPDRSFRGWLRDLCRCRSLDFLRVKRRENRHVEDYAGELDEAVRRLRVPVAQEADDVSDGRDDHRAFILHEAEKAQGAVRSRVEPRTWDVYWRIAIEDATVAETAAAFGITYTAAFAAYSRVDRRLRDEGVRRLAALRNRLL